MLRSAAIAVLLVSAAVATWDLDGELEVRSKQETGNQELLYLPNGKMLKVASLGQAPVLADLIYLWAIQYYSDYERKDRFRYVEHVFGDVIAELNPHYVDPYWLGAMILTVEEHDLEAGLRLLDKGFANNPDTWILPYLAGWECYHAGQYELAATYFDRAAAVPSAPPLVLRMRAGMVSRAGDLRAAIRLWQAVLQDPRSEEVSIAIAKRQVTDLTIRADLEDLNQAVERFRKTMGHWPSSLERLVAQGYLSTVPRDPRDREYHYDARTGKVTAAADRVLGAS